MKKLQELAYTVYEHEAINNNFYRRWMSGKLNIPQLKIFVRNYWEWTFRFPEALAGLIMNVDNIEARTEYTKTLFSEMGNGHVNQVHSFLFEEFSNRLAHQYGEKDSLNIYDLRKFLDPLDETQDLIHWQKDTYQHDYAIAAGAQLALEWQAYTMISKLYEGARNYMDLWPNQDDFHEACEFFYAHIGAAEKEHKDESIIAAAKLIENGAQFEDIALGFRKNLELIASFWNAIAKAIDNAL